MARPKTLAEDADSISAKEIEPGKWQASARFRTLGGELKRIRKTGTTKGQTLAAIKAEIKKRQEAGGSTEEHSGRTISQTTTLWLANIEPVAPTITASGEAVLSSTNRITVQTWKQHVRYSKTLIAGLGGVESATLTTRQCEVFLHGLVNVRADSGHSVAYPTRVVLSQVLIYAIRMGVRRENPASSINPLPRKVSKSVAPSFELIIQVRGWIQAYSTEPRRRGVKPNRRVADIFELLLATGARIGEVMALRWADVDLENGTISISGTLVEWGGLYRQPHPKSEKSFRTLLLTEWALEMLKELYEIRDPNSVSGAVFTTSTGKFVNTSTFRRCLLNALDWAGETGLEGVHPHAFRKAVATVLAEGLGDGAAMQQPGHSSPEVTRKAYIQRPGVGPDYRQVLEGLAPERLVSG